jgi:CDP-diacylglycerol--glycerol-3-phosphate 3-phosphatidyltransferase
MTSSIGKPGSPWNVPNLLTTVRLVLAIAVIVLIAVGSYLPALVTFLLAASTDWLDGYWARKYGQVTKLGRIFDPFVDKIIICGTFIALVAVPTSGIAAWAAVVVVGRELLVTSLRAIIEGAGGDFSATFWGKWKMVFQCAAVAFSLLWLLQKDPANWLGWVRDGTVTLAVAITIYSGIDYTLAAARVLGREGAE